MVPDTTNKAEQLLPERYPQTDLFICDVADAVLKDLTPHMEHPFYSLSKKPETNIRHYKHNGNWIEITPSVKGLATIYDKDILIYCISQIMAKFNKGEKVSRRVKVNCRDLLQFTNRGTAGTIYKALIEALDRLEGTRIRTNIRRGDEEISEGFGLINASSVKRKYGRDGRLLSCEIEISDWVFDIIRSNGVLTLHRDYFRLKKPLERRVYEIARKHCGQAPNWKISLELLLKKSGSQSPIKKFRHMVKHIVSHDHLPDYSVTYDSETDQVTFTNRKTMPIDKPKKWDGQLKPGIFEKLATMGLQVDKYALEQDFRVWVAAKGIEPENPEGLFLSFAETWKKKNAA